MDSEEESLKKFLFMDENEKGKLLSSLIKKNPNKSFQFIRKLLSNEDGNIRNETSSILDKIKWEPANSVERIYYLIAKEKWDDLKEIGSEAVEPLIELIINDLGDDREEAIRCLGKIKDDRAINYLIDLLEEEIFYVEPPEVFEVVFEALSSQKSPKSIGLLIGILKIRRDGLYQHYAQKTLESIGEEATEPLIDCLKSIDPFVREGAAEALGNIGNARAVEPLTKLLKDRSIDVRMVVQESLDKITLH